MTLLVRDEEDVLDAHLAFHRAAGVDHFVATDHASRDRTPQILEKYAAQGILEIERERDPVKRQSEWVTRMARRASSELDADWVINSDADEFWWPSGGDLKQVLARVPDRYGIVRTFVRPFLPQPGEGPFSERMTVRLGPPAPLNSPFTAFRVNVRLLHRAAPDVEIGFGNAKVRSKSLVSLSGGVPVEVLHFPIRSREQFERKFLTKHATAGGRNRGDTGRVVEASRAGRLDELYDEVCVDADRLERGLEAGVLAVDTRLRDALRVLAVDPQAALAFPELDLPMLAGIAVDADVLAAGELVRLARRVDEGRSRLERRRRSGRERRPSRGP